MKLSIAQILKTLSDDKSLLLFKEIAHRNSEDSHDTGLSRQRFRSYQDYSRMSKLVKADLVKRNGNDYFLTHLGKVVNVALNAIAMAIKDYWKPKAVDSIEMSEKLRLSETEYNNLPDTLIDYADITDTLVRHHDNYAIEKKKTIIQESRYATTITTIQKSR